MKKQEKLYALYVSMMKERMAFIEEASSLIKEPTPAYVSLRFVLEEIVLTLKAFDEAYNEVYGGKK